MVVLQDRVSGENGHTQRVQWHFMLAGRFLLIGSSLDGYYIIYSLSWTCLSFTISYWFILKSVTFGIGPIKSGFKSPPPFVSVAGRPPCDVCFLACT
jgi:hypothetical protein